MKFNYNLVRLILVFLVIIIFSFLYKRKEKFDNYHHKVSNSYNYENNPPLENVIIDFDANNLNQSKNLDMGVKKDLNYNLTIPLPTKTNPITKEDEEVEFKNSPVFTLQQEFTNEIFESDIINPILNNNDSSYVSVSKNLSIPLKEINNDYDFSIKNYVKFNHNIIKKYPLLDNIYNMLKEEILKRINEELKLFTNGDDILFQLIQDEIINIYYQNKDLIFIFNVIIHRYYKTHTFNLQIKISLQNLLIQNNNIIILKNNNNNYIINNIVVIGNTFEGDISKNYVGSNYNYKGVNNSKLVVEEVFLSLIKIGVLIFPLASAVF